MKFRIVKNRLGYFPQVKKWFWWYKIAKHPVGGYGLYNCKDIDYPKSLNESKNIISGYIPWCALDKKFKVVWRS